MEKGMAIQAHTKEVKSIDDDGEKKRTTKEGLKRMVTKGNQL